MSLRLYGFQVSKQRSTALRLFSSTASKGFTLVELLLVVGILAVVFGLALPFALNTKFTNELDTATENLITTLREAQSQAIAAEGDTPYGVYFDSSSSPQKYTIYRGASWASKDESFNVGGYGTTELPKSATVSFNWTGSPNNEITFARLTGKIIDVSDVSIGTSWTARNSAADNRWTSVTYGNGLFVAVACGVNSIMCNGTVGNRIMTSPDGIAWTLRNSPANYSWTSVTYGNGLFVAVAASGTGDRVMTSGKLNALYREIKISIPDIGSKDIKVTTEGLIY